MTNDERAKKQERAPSNVRPFIRRSALSKSKTERSEDHVTRGRNAVEDEDPGPSAACGGTRPS